MYFLRNPNTCWRLLSREFKLANATSYLQASKPSNWKHASLWQVHIFMKLLDLFDDNWSRNLYPPGHFALNYLNNIASSFECFDFMNACQVSKSLLASESTTNFINFYATNWWRTYAMLTAIAFRFLSIFKFCIISLFLCKIRVNTLYIIFNYVNIESVLRYCFDNEFWLRIFWLLYRWSNNCLTEVPHTKYLIYTNYINRIDVLIFFVASTTL